MEGYEFDSPEDLINWIREKTDDLQEVQIPLATNVGVVSSNGEQVLTKGAGAILLFINGRQSIIRIEDAEALINDGVLHRMGIKIKLRPMMK